jgi:hypothetical protein
MARHLLQHFICITSLQIANHRITMYQTHLLLQHIPPQLLPNGPPFAVAAYLHGRCLHCTGRAHQAAAQQRQLSPACTPAANAVVSTQRWSCKKLGRICVERMQLPRSIEA